MAARNREFAQALELYRQGDLPAAAGGFTALLEKFPADGPAETFLGRCQRFQDDPPCPGPGLRRIRNKGPGVVGNSVPFPALLLKGAKFNRVHATNYVDILDNNSIDKMGNVERPGLSKLTVIGLLGLALLALLGVRPPAGARPEGRMPNQVLYPDPDFASAPLGLVRWKAKSKIADRRGLFKVSYQQRQGWMHRLAFPQLRTPTVRCRGF